MTASRSTPRVSIGLPVCNGERHLAQTLQSIAAQTFGDFELVICDNAALRQRDGSHPGASVGSCILDNSLLGNMLSRRPSIDSLARLLHTHPRRSP